MHVEVLQVVNQPVKNYGAFQKKYVFFFQNFICSHIISVIGTISFELDGTFDPLLTFTQIRRSIIPAPGKSFIIADCGDSECR